MNRWTERKSEYNTDKRYMHRITRYKTRTYRFIFDVRREPCDKKARKRSKTGNKADTGALSFCGLSVFPDCDGRERSEREQARREQRERLSTRAASSLRRSTETFYTVSLSLVPRFHVFSDQFDDFFFNLKSPSISEVNCFHFLFHCCRLGILRFLRGFRRHP